MSNKTLTPSYLDIDFSTLKQNFINKLAASDLFKDYDFEGSNTSLLIEFISYLTELNTYYLNKIAQNIYDETSDLYENVHRLSTFRGYYPKGYVAAQTDITLTLTQASSGEYFAPGDQIYIPAWYSLTTTDGKIPFITTRSYYGTIPTSASLAYETTFSVKQGELFTQTYKGSDIIDGKIILPFYQFDHDDNVDDDYISILVEVDDTPWTRIADFYDDISGLQSINEVYTFNYDKYQRYTIEFSSSRSIPDTTNVIKVTAIKTLGSSGTVGANLITEAKEGLVYNVTKQLYIPVDNFTITNLLASDPGSSPQDLDTIKSSARGMLHSQFRCVTKADYIAFLETRTDIFAGNAWGEQEINPEGDTALYNKTYISVIPTNWSSGTINTSASTWTPYVGVTGDILVPTSWSSTWQSTIAEYLEPRKMLNAYEIYVIPDLVYFAFNIGIRLKRSYNFIDVMQDVKDKLTYYFANIKTFNCDISFMDISNYILDPANVSETNTFSNVKGIDSFIFRDIITNKTIYSYGSEYYPQYTRAEFDTSIDNKIKVIKLGLNQFPMFLSNLCSFSQEF